jgi:hypothetical protein
MKQADVRFPVRDLGREEVSKTVVPCRLIGDCEMGVAGLGFDTT